MKFLIDANSPRALCALLSAMGHDAIHALDLQMGAAPDTEIAALAKRESRCLITRDFDFSDIRSYPPGQYSGLVVLDLPDTATAATICAMMKPVFEDHSIINGLAGRLAIVAFGRVRFRPALVS